MAEFELTIRIPAGGTTISIPTRERVFTPGVAGGRVSALARQLTGSHAHARLSDDDRPVVVLICKIGRGR
jgi:hypothetical protein